jgi:hypothetical protein
MGRVVALNLNYAFRKYFEGIFLYILIPYRVFMHIVYSWICIVLTWHSGISITEFQISITSLICSCITPVIDRRCGLVVRVPGDRSRGPGSIPGTTRFFFLSSGSGTESTQSRDYNCGATWNKK